ncbi:hypothetical protein ACGFK1_04455 [Mycobacterium sp. NPDC048908]|uniref:hypothetical protein n=1 Tax=Mycobacterium sp. NPDC048908 TaxID=3364292 RepID=UPI0037172FC2
MVDFAHTRFPNPHDDPGERWENLIRDLDQNLVRLALLLTEVARQQAQLSNPSTRPVGTIRRRHQRHGD